MFTSYLHLAQSLRQIWCIVDTSNGCQQVLLNGMSSTTFNIDHEMLKQSQHTFWIWASLVQFIRVSYSFVLGSSMSYFLVPVWSHAELIHLDWCKQVFLQLLDWTLLECSVDQNSCSCSIPVSQEWFHNRWLFLLIHASAIAFSPRQFGHGNAHGILRNYHWGKSSHQICLCQKPCNASMPICFC